MEENLRVIVGSFVEVSKRRVLKVNTEMKTVMGLGKEEGSICEALADGIPLEQVSRV